MNYNVIIEGVDRLGKSTLINNLKQELGFFQVVHYQKPELLRCYQSESLPDPLKNTEREIKSQALKRYQYESFKHMFKMLHFGGFIMDRAHIGEAVYAKRYRGYDGNYVFALEDEEIAEGNCFENNTLLILLYTSDFSFIKDDGDSFDFSKKEEEQEDFIEAFMKSRIRNKIFIDVANDQGGFKSPEDIYKMAVASNILL